MAKIGNDQSGEAPSGPRDLAGLGGPADGWYDIRIGRDGTWYYQGGPIRRPALVKLFASVLSRDEAGDYWLKTPAERGRIRVDDAPFVAVELEREGDGPGQTLWLRTNIDAWVPLDADHPLRTAFSAGMEAPAPYILISQGLEARVARSVYYRLVDLAEERAGRIGVYSRHGFFPLDAPGEARPDTRDGR
jgi:hypothetical protein